MTETEITDLPPLKPNERSLLEMHSVLNIFNVLRGELVLIGLTLANNPDLLARALAICDGLIKTLHDANAGLATARDTDQHVQSLKAEVEAALAARPELGEHPEIKESLANLGSVYAILRTRAREQLARAQAPDRWLEFSAAALERDFHAAFAAIEKNSHGRYRILYNAALQTPPDYYLDLKIEGKQGDQLRMPAVFQDVMRDLIANARKYTPPGGHITAALHESAGTPALRRRGYRPGHPAG